MGTTVKAYGNFMFDNLPGFGLGAGVRSMFGTLIPPGSRVTYVRSTGWQDGDPPELNFRILSTLAAGLAECRSGLNDFVVLLPGHSESVVDATMLTNLVAGTTILGTGQGSSMATFRWTATAAQWAITVANVAIIGCRLRLEGANGVVKAIVCTAADCAMLYNDIEMASGAALKAVIGVEIGAGANRFNFAYNLVRGTADVVTDPIKGVGTPDMVNISDNDILCAGTSATGCVHITTVWTNMRMLRNNVANLTAVSIAGIGVDNVAATGLLANNNISTLSTGAQVSNTNGIFTGAGALVRAFQNFSSNDPRASGMLLPTVDT